MSLTPILALQADAQQETATFFGRQSRGNLRLFAHISLLKNYKDYKHNICYEAWPIVDPYLYLLGCFLQHKDPCFLEDPGGIQLLVTHNEQIKMYVLVGKSSNLPSLMKFFFQALPCKKDNLPGKMLNKIGVSPWAREKCIKLSPPLPSQGIAELVLREDHWDTWKCLQLNWCHGQLSLNFWRFVHPKNMKNHASAEKSWKWRQCKPNDEFAKSWTRILRLLKKSGHQNIFKIKTSWVHSVSISMIYFTFNNLMSIMFEIFAEFMSMMFEEFNVNVLC